MLLKIYGDAGLLQLAKVAGHRAETLTSLVQASHFKRTHHFILQSLEVMHRYFIRMYIASDEVGSLTSTINEIAYSLANLGSENDDDDMLKKYKTSFDTILSDIPPHFSSFMDKLCSDPKTCQFWFQYITTHCLAYIGFLIAIRNGDCILRMAAIKSMATVFSALDRLIYQRLIPQHLADLLCFPKEVMQHLQKGAFTVQLSEGNGHAVRLDEVHEMKINKDAKFSVVRSSPEIMNRISNLMPFRAQCLNSLIKHLPSNVPKSTSRDRIADGNVQVYNVRHDGGM